MARFENTTTHVIVSVDDSKADRFGFGWKALDGTDDPDGSTPLATIDEILADVGDDQAKAAAALEAEQARDKPRSTLVAKLTELADAGK